jgi:uncharacterized CHY-type Zn-finger protein
MGTIYQATCPCGFKQIDLLQGYGINQGDTHYQLYQCEQCHALASIELIQQTDSLFKPIRCTECKSTMERLPNEPEEQAYSCPECKQASLQLQITRLWD